MDNNKVQKNMEDKLAELIEENTLLHTQAKLLKTELEKYYNRFQKMSQTFTDNSRLTEKIKETEQAHARLVAREAALKKLFEQKYGDMDVFSSRRSQPGILKLIFAGGYGNKPTAKLGGDENFAPVIETYKKGGVPGVAALLNSEPVTAKVWANAFTAIAKNLRKTDAVAAADLALLAWQLDPRPYRLKWLAFRVHDAGDAVLADTIIDVLPENIEMKDNEKSRIQRIRKESNHTSLDAIKWSVANSAGLDQNNNFIKRIESLVYENASLKTEFALKEQAARIELDNLKLAISRNESMLEAEKNRTAEKNHDLVRIMARYTALRSSASCLKKEYENSLEKLEGKIASLEQEKNRAVAKSMELQAIVDNGKELANALRQLDESQNESIGQIKAGLESLARSCASISDDLHRQRGHLDDSIVDLEDKLLKANEAYKWQLQTAMRQQDALNSLKQYFNGAGLPSVEYWNEGWPACPDFMLNLVRMIENNKYDLIVEFGSGMTTLFAAKTVGQKMQANDGFQAPEIVSFDHLEQFFDKTKAGLATAGLENLVRINLCQLEQWIAPDGQEYRYYSCENILQELSAKYKDKNCRILVIVDGPPGATCKNARYPAFPLIMHYFSPARIDFIMDDYKRGDEREIIDKWNIVCESCGIVCKKEKLDLSKGACVFQVN